jgi:uncharacterized protein
MRSDALARRARQQARKIHREKRRCVKYRFVIFALSIAAALFLCARPASAAPALWVVQSPTSKVYLFGTVHLLRDGTQWRSPELDAAMKESQDLYLEIADPSVTASALTSLVKIGFDRAHPLSTKISKADVALLSEAAKRYGLGGEATFEPMQPWLAYMLLSTMPAVRSGYAPGNGVDLQVRKDFVAAGKPVYGFETFDMQAHIFADMPEAMQIALLETQLKSASPGTAVANLDALVAAWISGNQEHLASLLQLDKLAQSPIYAKLLTDRNKAWASALAARLKQPGTSFVSVGAAHMVGPDGVPALLGHMGYAVTRVPIADTPATTSPAPSSSETSQPTSSPLPTPTASATPIPQTLTPPPGWTARAVTFSAGGFKADAMWVDPHRLGVVLSGHLDLPGVSAIDLDTLDALFHQGLVAGAGEKGSVQPSTRVKICGGKQDGTYSKLTLKTIQEDIVLAVSDRGYVAEYARRKGVADDPAATRSLLTLCAP